jgi:hypothetical protein
MLGIFICTCWPFIYIVWRNTYANPVTILISEYLSFCYWVVSILYTMDIRFLSDTCFENIFSHSWACLSSLKLFSFLVVTLTLSILLLPCWPSVQCVSHYWKNLQLLLIKSLNFCFGILELYFKVYSCLQFSYLLDGLPFITV